MHEAAAAEFEDAVSLLPTTLRTSLSVKRLVVCIFAALKGKNAKYIEEIMWSMIGDLRRIGDEPGYCSGAFLLVASSDARMRRWPSASPRQSIS